MYLFYSTALCVLKLTIHYGYLRMVSNSSYNTHNIFQTMFKGAQWNFCVVPEASRYLTLTDSISKLM